MPVSELDADKNPVRGYVLGNEYISQVNGTSFGYYLNDEQGSVRYLTGSDGSIRNHYRYSAFGETITAEETVPNRLRYNGQMADGLTGLYYLRARYYNASLGRFTQEDVIYNDGLNLYAYCNSNPVMYSDPSGFAKQCDPKVGGEKDSKTAKEIMDDRVQGFDLEAHPTSNKQLSSSKMKELKNKIDSRTATREEYNLYEWNKKMSQRRSEGVKDFWNQERERIISGEGTTRNWSQEQIADILSGKTPKYNGKPIQGHHAYSVSQYPHLANKGEVIYPVTLNEHLNGWHGGNFKNSLPGEPIVDIHDFD